MISTWMLYAAVVAVLIATGTWAAERALRQRRLPVRCVWLTGIVLSVFAPAVAWHLSPSTDRSTSIPAVSVGELEFAVVPVPVPTSWSDGTGLVPALLDLDPLLLPGWLLISVLLAAALSLDTAMMLRRQRKWREATVDGTPVLVSSDTGPAVIGFVRPTIVLPAWVLEWNAAMKQLIVEHEREHIQARDPLVIAAGLAAVVLMPWNPALWWQFRRLRLATETDCDARVLRGRADVWTYGNLLLEVGRVTATRRMVLAAFSEPRSFLERRIRMILAPRSRRPFRRALPLLAIATLVPAAALAIPTPDRPDMTTGDDPPDTPAPAPSALIAPFEVADTPQVDEGDLSQEPTFTPYEVRPEMLNRTEYQRELTINYPPELREAGIDGTVILWLFIDAEGTVTNTKLEASSGHPELDAVALEAARVLRFTPALNKNEQVPVWIQFPVTFQVEQEEEEAPPAPDDELQPPPMASPPEPTPRPRFTPYTDRPEMLNEGALYRTVEANYSPELREAGIGGTVMVWLFINESGAIASARVAESSGYPELDEFALRAVRVLRFSPARNRGEPVAVWIQMPLNFQADEPELETPVRERE